MAGVYYSVIQLRKLKRNSAKITAKAAMQNPREIVQKRFQK